MSVPSSKLLFVAKWSIPHSHFLPLLTLVQNPLPFTLYLLSITRSSISVVLPKTVPKLTYLVGTIASFTPPCVSNSAVSVPPLNGSSVPTITFPPSLSVPHRYSISTFLLSDTKLLPPLISLCLFATLARLFIRMFTCLLQLPKLNKPSSDSFHHVPVTPLHSLRLAQGALGVGGSVRSMVVLQ